MTTRCPKRTLLILLVCLIATPAFSAENADGPRLAVFRLQGEMTEKPQGDDLLFGSAGTLALTDVVSRMEKAADDDNVKGVVWILGNLSIGRAQIEELLQAAEKVKAAGKRVHAHTGSLSTTEYILLSGASSISIVPTADIWLTGFFGESPYLRGLLDKLGVVPDYLTCGEYKSAAEIFMRKEPSPEADKMQNWLLDSIFTTTLETIAKGRQTTPDQVHKWIDNAPYTAEKAKQLKIVDNVETLQQFEERLKQEYGNEIKFDKKYGKKKSQEIDFNNPFAVLRLWGELLQGSKPKKSTKDSVAIVYVEGPIVEGSAQQNPFGSSGIAFSSAIRKALKEVADDDSIKAMVLRINSPGGSAVASEIILQGTKHVKAKKPIVVSMGDVAASGGYYVTCAADTIFAERFTITGSIGVVGGKFATTKMWDKIGVQFKSYSRGKNAGILSSEKPFSEQEREKMQSWMDEIYAVFKKHVTDSRGSRLKKDIEELAGGRVYTGVQALELGLVDKIGSLDDAVEHVAEKAGIKDYEVRIVPKPKNFLEALIEDLVDENGDEDSLIRMSPQSSGSGILDLALPMLQQLDPHRLSAVKLALQRLDLIQRERAVLMMPEIIVSH